MGSLASSPAFDVLLRNANINGVYVCDIGIQAGVITAIGMQLSSSESTQVIDCEYAVVTPGGVDAHVHLSQDKSPRAKEAGYVAADTIETGTRSAVAGGTTTVLLFAEQSRGQSVAEQVARYHETAAQIGSYADYGFHAIITDPTTKVLDEELPVLARTGGITSMKLFLTYKHMRLSDAQFLRALKAARELGMVALVHAENGDLVDFFTEQLESLGLTQTQYKAVAHPAAAESEAVNRAVTFSSVMDTPMLIVHVSVRESMEVIRRAQASLKPVFAETCPQYLLLGKERLAEAHFCGAKYICSPPLRSDPNDIEAIWRGIANGTFTIFSSDHCPYRFNDPHGKQLGQRPNDNGTYSERFTQVPNGLPGVETRVPLLYSEGVLKRRCIDTKRFVELTSENPAKLYGLYPKKGAIQIGSDADIVVWHPQSTFRPRRLSHARDLHDACDYSPYEGIEFWNWPRMTLLRGQVVFKDGVVVAKNGVGRFVPRHGCGMPYVRRMEGTWDVLRAAV
ncbi:dihydropyrimidinase [Sporothrix schenckii 1099-18]|uniref:dihydropyrimidinase n=2 Tax=Sporothrix schenckii TaxID=29908 RepID=U7PID9_SPOS1|nr:dihydropyrimidinase [Sporothrix schenckii 1099-18]ERS95307.1 dihydropyrimidinase [Sporothrix schenckii ATCC 58251]KJR87584.1 dihydropyrimidinase [Sporothrix schenckii 1099-18]